MKVLLNKVSSIILFLAIGLAIGEQSSTKVVPTTSEPTSSTLPPSTTLLPTSTEANVTTSTSTSTTPITSSTSVPVTTSAPKPPVPEDGSWNVTDGNVTCIRAELKIEFTNVISDNRTETVILPANATSTGTCSASNVTQSFPLAWEDYALDFEFVKDSDKVFVRNITFSTSTHSSSYNGTKLFVAKAGNSYLCRSTESVVLGSVTMKVYKIHIQAFEVENTNGFSTADECEADDSISDVVPIAVGCALAALIIIVLIAYLIGRRRSRQKGYASV